MNSAVGILLVALPLRELDSLRRIAAQSKPGDRSLAPSVRPPRSGSFFLPGKAAGKNPVKEVGE